MKIAALMNTINRYGLTSRVTEHNINSVGDHELDLLISDNGSEDPRVIKWGKEVAFKHWDNGENIGNSAAKNVKLKFAMENDYDFICILDNDIALPENWADKAIETMATIEEKSGRPGMIGWSWRGHKASEARNPYGVFTPKRVFGSWMAKRELFESVGYFVELSKYGYWDSEFNERCTAAGFVNAYPMESSRHLGDDMFDSVEYREFKDSELRKATSFASRIEEEGKLHISWEERVYEH